MAEINEATGLTRQFLLVEWWDAESFGDDGWTSLSEIKEWAAKPFPLVQSVGELLHEGEHWLVLLASRSADADEEGADGFHAMKIPKLWIKRRLKLHV